MSWRVVTVTGKCKLELRLGYMVCRGETTVKVHLSEIYLLMVESTTAAVTTSLLCELLKRKIKVLFCDEKHNPVSELTPVSLRYDTSGRLRRQMRWEENNKQTVWTSIVRHKIFQQMSFLNDAGFTNQAKMLFEYIAGLQLGDVTNREGHAAKVYFNALFGQDFSRSSVCNVNAALDYGYSILLSAFNREVAIGGYSANIGINHNNEFNHFNLSCDLMEPFRPLVDRKVRSMNLENFTREQKHSLQRLLCDEITYDGKRYSVNNAIGIYTRKTLNCIENGNAEVLDFYSL